MRHKAFREKKINVIDWDIDFLVASGHKMYGPTGTGFLYIKPGVEKEMRPFTAGGGMILEVTQDAVTYQDPPEGFEAGTPHIAGNIVLGTAVDYIMSHGIEEFEKTEQKVTRYAYEKLSEIEGLHLFSHPKTHGVLSFTMDGVHPHDIGEILNRRGVAIRTGNHCAMPIHHRFGIPATARISLACYNTTEDIDTAIEGLNEVKRLFA